jgi:outer membrane lipase/esterase
MKRQKPKFKIIVKQVALAGLAAIGAASASAQSTAVTPMFSNIYVYGDSLSDTGNLGRFTNGGKLVWADYIAAAFGKTMAPAYSYATGKAVLGSGNGFAIGAARVNDTPRGPLTILGTGSQINDSIRRGLDKEALHLVWIGGNDLDAQLRAVVAGGTTTAAATGMIAAAQGLVQQVGVLQAAGAKNILVMNLPNLAATPMVAAFGAQGQQLAGLLTDTFNGTLKAGMSGKNVIQFDVYTLFNDIIANPMKYGFSNNNSPVCGTVDSAACSLPSNGFLFADSLHPSTYAHSLLGEWVAGALRSTSDTAGLAAMAGATPLGRSGAQWRTVENRTRNFQNNGQKGDVMYVAGDYADARVNAANGAEAASGETFSGAIGFDTTVGTNMLVGASFGVENAPFTLANKGGSLRYKESTLTAYFSYLVSNCYLNGLASYGDLNYTTQRNVVIGPLSAVEHAAFGGKHSGLKLQMGYRMKSAGLNHGPFAGYDWENVDIDGFSEGTSATAVSVSSQSVKQSHLRVGYEVSAETAWGSATARPFAQLSYDYQLNNDTRSYSAGMTSTGTQMPVSLRSEAGGYGKVAVGVNSRLGNKTEIGVSLGTTFSNPAGRDQSFNVVVSTAF